MWLEHYRTFWDTRLAALEAFLLKKERRRRVGAGRTSSGGWSMTVTDEAAPVLVVRRQMAVPRERVFEAWLDSESLAHWMRPGNLTHATVTVDPRVGGGFRIVMEGRPDGVRRAPRRVLGDRAAVVAVVHLDLQAHGPQADGRHHRVPRAGRGDRAGPHAPALAAEGGRGASEGVDRHRARARRGADAGLAEEARTRRKRNGRRCASAVGQGMAGRNAAPKPAEPKLANRHRQRRSATVLPDRHLRFDSASESRFTPSSPRARRSWRKPDSNPFWTKPKPQAVDQPRLS